MEKTGKISGWQDAKGYGFILPDDGSARVFMHYSSLATDQARPRNGDVVRYTDGIDSKGNNSATKVWTRSSAELNAQRIAREREIKKRVKQEENQEKDYIALWISLPFLALLAALGITKQIVIEIPMVYLLLSIITFIAYRHDKNAALNELRRIPEANLHLLGLFGGWPGALIAQRMYRHKSSKQEFRAVFWVTVVINIFALLYIAKRLNAL